MDRTYKEQGKLKHQTMLYLGRLDNLTKERKIELEKKLQELKEPKLLDSYHIEINRLGYKESRYLIDEISIKEVLDFGDVAAQHKIFEKLDICGVINKYSTKGGGKIDVGRLAEIMAINRNCDPCSRRKLPSWFETTVLPILLNIKPIEINDKLFLRTFPYLQERTDRGMISTKNVKQLDLDLQSYVFALKLQNQERDIIDALRQNLKPINENTSLAEVMLVDNSRRKKYVVGHSKDIGELSAAGFEARLKRVEEKLQKTKARKYEGMFLLSTTEIHLKGEEILKVYREKDIIEKAFRTIKSEIEMRPFFLSSEKSVIGYVFICALAYQIRSVLKYHMKKSDSEMSIEDAFEILDRYKVVKMAVEGKSVQVYRKVAIEGQKAYLYELSGKEVKNPPFSEVDRYCSEA